MTLGKDVQTTSEGHIERLLPFSHKHSILTSGCAPSPRFQEESTWNGTKKLFFQGFGEKIRSAETGPQTFLSCGSPLDAFFEGGEGNLSKVPKSNAYEQLTLPNRNKKKQITQQTKPRQLKTIFEVSPQNTLNAKPVNIKCICYICHFRFIFVPSVIDLPEKKRNNEWYKPTKTRKTKRKMAQKQGKHETKQP